jgi:prepilin-type processing-associated H-X9-DG protein
MLSHLYTLLLVAVLIGASVAMFGSWCILFFILFLPIFAVFRGWMSLIAFLVTEIGLLLLPALLPAVSCVRESARRAQCCNNLKNISLALFNYESTYNCFPPAYVADKNGRPMHSWRVLILPYLEHRDLYRQYDFNEPWSSPNNRKLVNQRLSLYQCPSDDSYWHTEGSISTNYVAVVGVNAAWRQGKSVSLEDFSESQRASTVAVIDIANSGILWTEPQDLCLDDLDGPQSKIKMPIRSKHILDNGFFYHEMSGTNAAFLDGHGEFLSTENLTADQLKSLLAIGGCDVKNAVYSNIKPRIHWPHCAIFAVWCVAIVLLLHQAVRSRKQKAALEPAN